jgi:hypothetical protein
MSFEMMGSSDGGRGINKNGHRNSATFSSNSQVSRAIGMRLDSIERAALKGNSAAFEVDIEHYEMSAVDRLHLHLIYAFFVSVMSSLAIDYLSLFKEQHYMYITK